MQRRQRVQALREVREVARLHGMVAARKAMRNLSETRIGRQHLERYGLLLQSYDSGVGGRRLARKRLPPTLQKIGKLSRQPPFGLGIDTAVIHGMMHIVWISTAGSKAKVWSAPCPFIPKFGLTLA